jgi:hypothetical protein
MAHRTLNGYLKKDKIKLFSEKDLCDLETLASEIENENIKGYILSDAAKIAAKVAHRSGAYISLMYKINKEENAKDENARDDNAMVEVSSSLVTVAQKYPGVFNECVSIVSNVNYNSVRQVLARGASDAPEQKTLENYLAAFKDNLEKLNKKLSEVNDDEIRQGIAYCVIAAFKERTRKGSSERVSYFLDRIAGLKEDELKNIGELVNYEEILYGMELAKIFGINLADVLKQLGGKEKSIGTKLPDIIDQAGKKQPESTAS